MFETSGAGTKAIKHTGVFEKSEVELGADMANSNASNYQITKLKFEMTPQGSVTGGGSAAPEQITLNTVPSYYTVIYIMKIS
jgi:hypothetical protein